MKENEYLGKPGIDTEHERKQIEYRPTIEWKRPELFSEWAPLPSSEKDSINELARPATRELWNNLILIKESLDEIETDLSSRLHETDARIPSGLQEDLQRAAHKYGYTISDRIPFSLYKLAVRERDSLEKQLILDVFEGYHGDVHGNLLAEIYPDVAEMQDDWIDMFGFVNKGVFSQLVSEGDLPKEVSSEESIQQIEESEESLGALYKEAKEKEAIAIRNLQLVHLQSDDEGDFFKAKKEVDAIESILSTTERRLYTKREAIELSQSKARRAIRNIDILRFAIDVDHYAGEYRAILLPLLRQYTTGQSMEKGLRKLQVLLKLSIDGKNNEISDTKGNLRTLSGRNNRKRINGALVHGVHLRNEVSGETLDLMGRADAFQENEAFGRVAGHIMDSVSVSRDLYKDNAGDFYKMHTMESELRSEKISKLIDKDSAREIYKLLDNVISYGKERNHWPTERELSAWVDGFLASYNLM